MKTRDQILQIRSLLLYILKQFPDEADYIKLFRIMYFAQRTYLVTYGKQIVCETFFAHQLGPVPVFTYRALQSAFGDCERTSDL